MDTKYYSVIESIEILNNQGINITIEKLAGYVREKLITPVLYISSFVAALIKENSENRLSVAGFCYISGYICPKNIIYMFDELINGKTLELNEKYHVIHDDFVEKPTIQGWLNNIQTFIKYNIPTDCRNPQAYSVDLELYFQTLGAASEFKFTMQKVYLTKEDLACLNKESIPILKNADFSLSPKNPISSLKNGANAFVNRPDIDGDNLKPTKHNQLHELIKAVVDDMVNKSGFFPSSSAVWAKLRVADSQISNLDYDKDEIIQEIIDNKITWRSRYGSERKMTYSTFGNFLSKLRQANQKKQLTHSES